MIDYRNLIPTKLCKLLRWAVRRWSENAVEGSDKRRKMKSAREFEKSPSSQLSGSRYFAAEAVTRGGIPIVEITMTVPGALELMAHLVRSDPKVIVSAGTVLDTDTAHLVRGCGRRFRHCPVAESCDYGIRSQAECRSLARRLNTNRGGHRVERGC
jgi:hypothetical protein